MGKVVDLVADIARGAASEVGVELWDLEYVREGGERYLRIFIDHTDGVSIDQCERVSRIVDPKLDEIETLDESYILEVSSAGIERTLKKPEHFLRFIGSDVDVSLYTAVNSSKKHSGALVAYSEGETVISVGGDNVAFDNKNVSRVKLKPDYSGY